MKCNKAKHKELTKVEVVDCRIFYWAAFNGYNKYLRLMILHLRWSPYIKSFNKRSILSGAVWGSQIETLRMLLGNYKYEEVAKNSIIDLAITIYKKDTQGNMIVLGSRNQRKCATSYLAALLKIIPRKISPQQRGGSANFFSFSR